MPDSEPKILFVDDDRDVLEGIELKLRKHYHLEFAASGAEALEKMESTHYAVIVSDMRMPRMDGAQFLSQASEKSPDTIRMLLTGHTGIDTALAAINRGHIFRLLSKPCADDELMRNLDDALEQYRMVTQDKTLMKRKVEELSEQLVDAEKLAMLGTLAGGVGHELNNVATILCCVLPIVEELASEGQPPGAEELRDLRRVAEHLKNHGTHLQKLAQPLHDKAEELDLVEVIKNTLTILRMMGKTKIIDVKTEFSGDKVCLAANRARIEQIVINLVSNAADAILATKRRGEIVVSVDQRTDGVTIEVRDNGCGVSAESADTIFEPYFTTKPAGKGTGLGLPVVRNIVESLAGEISFESEPDQGSVFRVELPFHTDQPTPKRSDQSLPSLATAPM